MESSFSDEAESIGESDSFAGVSDDSSDSGQKRKGKKKSNSKRPSKLASNKTPKSKKP